MTKRYLLDSMIIVWGIKKTGNDKDKIEEAEKFIDFIDKSDKIELYIPTPVITEILSPYSKEDDKYDEIVSEIGKHFIILPFDYQSSVIASRLLNEYGKDPDLLKMLKSESDYQFNIKSKMKVDIQVVSIGIAHNLDGIISEDRNAIKSYSENRIDVLSMHNVLNKDTMFEDGKNLSKNS